MKHSVIMLLLLLGCSKSDDDAQPSSPLAGKKVIFIGDSIVFGYGASTQNNRWTTLFCNAEKCLEYNIGVPGEVLQNGVSCAGHPPLDKTTIPIKTTDEGALFIALGMNDVGMTNGTMTPAAYQSALSDLIDYAITTKGWSKSQIIIVSPTYTVAFGYYAGGCGAASNFDATRLKAYVSAALAAATSKECLSANVYEAMANSSVPSSLLGPDGLHPSDKAYSIIAEF